MINCFLIFAFNKILVHLIIDRLKKFLICTEFFQTDYVRAFYCPTFIKCQFKYERRHEVTYNDLIVVLTIIFKSKSSDVDLSIQDLTFNCL